MTPPRTGTAGHAWTLQHLMPCLAGLLTEEEEQQVQAHLAVCKACAERYRLMTEQAGSAAAGDHIPAAILARWGRASAQPKGLEREMVVRHLEKCADCRHELEVLGHSARLDAGASQAAGDVSTRARTRAGHPIPRARRDTRWTSWALGGWGTLATAAAVVLAIMRNPALPSLGEHETGNPLPAPAEIVAEHSPPSSVPAGEDPGKIAAPPPVTNPAAEAYLSPARVGRLPEVTRGSETLDLLPTPLPSAGETLVLRLPALPEYPAETPASVRFLGPDAQVVAHFDTAVGKLRESPFVTFVNVSMALSPGIYVLQVQLQPPAPALAHTVEYRFSLRAS